MEEGKREAERWRTIVEHMKNLKDAKIKEETLVKIKVTDNSESKYYVS